MKATVVTRFNDAILKRIFEVGENYPVDQLEENRVEERVNLLSKPHPKTGKVYIFVEQQAEQQADEVPSTEQAEQQADEASAPVEEKPKSKRKTPTKIDGE